MLKYKLGPRFRSRLQLGCRFTFRSRLRYIYKLRFRFILGSKFRETLLAGDDKQIIPVFKQR
jgi:hypothetical protein